ncbi:hypothetical protein L1887_09674 [Cichorium endivia]|nr:hypothetical protein L1887_09674 [Cichorium endivia]
MEATPTYSLVGFFCITLLLITITYASNICKRSGSPPLATISFGTTSLDDARHPRPRKLLWWHRYDDDVLVTFPSFIFSEVTMPHKGDTANEPNASGCSIWITTTADVVRLLPPCGHLFHVKCIDTWLKAHPILVQCVGIRLLPGRCNRS